MAKRLAAGRFSPGKKEQPEVEGPPSVVRETSPSANGVESIDVNTDDKIFTNEEDADEEDDENVDLSVVRSVLGASFRLEKDTTSTSRNVSFSGVDSVESDKADEIKTRGELLSKIERLQDNLKQAQLDCSAEKARRKKSSRSTIKLAKEINKRTIEAAAIQKSLAKVHEI
jgi:hypothetical protein